MARVQAAVCKRCVCRRGSRRGCVGCGRCGKGEEIGDVEVGENLEEQLRGRFGGTSFAGVMFRLWAYLVDCVGILW